MKTIAAFSTPMEAYLVLARLHSAGIDAVIRDEFLVTVDWFCSNAIGGVKIEVVEEDVDAAREIVRLPPPEEALLRCPYCGSSDTRVRVLSVFGAICIMLKLPIPMTRAIVDCRACRKTHDVAIDGKNDRPGGAP
jgi:hypothetical protein